MNEFAVQLHHLFKSYSEPRQTTDVAAVHDVNLSINSGEFFTLLGPSGCGKTTTLRLIAGFETATSGSIFIQGQRINDVPPHLRPVNTVFQNYALFPHLTVAQNVGFGLKVKHVKTDERNRRVKDALDLVRLSELGERKPAQLSGGQQQRVALARAIVNEPAVLLLDEPLGALDLKLRKTMQLELKHLQSQLGMTFIYVTHDQEEALVMSDRIAVMSQGRVLQVDSPVVIYEKPVSRFVADFIGESNFLQGAVEEVSHGNISVKLADDRRFTFPTQIRGLPKGSDVVLTIRPEKLRLLEPNGHVAANALSGVIQDITYLGTDTRYSVELSSSEMVYVRMQNMRDRVWGKYAIGDPVDVQWSPEDVQVLVE